ncbi:redoxin family protein [Aeromonas veronii]|uniref:redoxin family protein n=1 Tax=Aeromonas veronii TaxID=654 RepID=UPI003B9F68BD
MQFLSKLKAISFIVLSGVSCSGLAGEYATTSEHQALGKGETVTFNKDATFHLEGMGLKVGDLFPMVALRSPNLDEVMTGGSGKKKVYVVVPSLDTPVCQVQVKELDALINKYKDDFKNVDVTVVSADTPFSQARYITAEHISPKVKFLSDYVDHKFGLRTGTQIRELSLLSRGVFVVNDIGVITYMQRVPELTAMPDMMKAIKALQKI